MRLQKAIKYHLLDAKKAIIIFYAIIIVLSLFFQIFLNVLVMRGGESNGEQGTFNVDTSSIVFLVIMSIISMTATFQFFLQNGVSRRVFFLSSIFSKGMIAACMTVLDIAIPILSGMFFKEKMVNQGILDTLYMFWYAGEKTAAFYLDQTLLRFALYLFFVILASFIGALYYRMGKMMKILVSAGVPILFTIVLPVVDWQLTNGKIFGAIADFFLFISGFKNGGNPYYLMISSLIGAVLFCIPTWLLVRRATIKS